MHYKLCVMGNPIEHSRSPQLHKQFAKQFNLSLSYTKIKPDKNNFFSAVTAFKNEGGFGLNVTAPFKQDAFQLATQLSPRAAIAKSVNTLMFTEENNIYGDNTDGIGLIRDITQNIGYDLSNKTILIIGAGGAARGILHDILLQAPNHVFINNRTFEKAAKLTTEFQGQMTACNLNQLENILIDVVIDSTGHASELTLPPLLSLTENSLCYDLKYSNQPTHFMHWAKSKNARIITDGMGMLIEQAAEAFFVWTGKRPRKIVIGQND